MQGYAIILRPRDREELTLENLALHANVHPDMVWQLVEFGLIAPIARRDQELLFDLESVLRLRRIVRLRQVLGINLAGVSVVLDLLDRLQTVQRENEMLRNRN